MKQLLIGTVLDPLWIAKRSLKRGILGAAHHAHGRLLDVGCGIKPYRAMFPQCREYLGIERPGTLSHSRVVDVWGDALQLPFAPATMDTVLCNEVLEHVPEPSQLFAEAARVLRPGGILLLTTPQVWGLHEEPWDFYRYTRYGLSYLAKKHGFEVVSVTPTCGTWAMAGQRTASWWFYSTGLVKIKPLNLAVRPLLALWQLIAVALDEITGRRGDTLDNVLVARKVAS